LVITGVIVELSGTGVGGPVDGAAMDETPANSSGEVTTNALLAVDGVLMRNEGVGPVQQAHRMNWALDMFPESSN
jgi:hypothetical protein